MKKLIRSFGYAFNGLAYATKTQLNFRVHLVASLLACFLGYALQVATVEWMWIVACIAIVLMAELFNTALEFLVDLVSPDYNELAGRVKDVAAGAVVVAAVFAVIEGLIIFLPKILALTYAA
ncbi:MAG: diacylglycerol kinase family protein [Bacteroidota bacterium]